MQVTHRSGPLKQQNKSHKTGRHRSKGAVDNDNKGRIGIKAITKSKKAAISKRDRRNQLNQHRAKKKAEILALKRSIGGAQSPPLLTAIIDLQNADSHAVKHLTETLKTCADDIVATENPRGDLHLACPRFKQRFAFVTPKKNDMHEILDACKVSDAVIMVVSVEEELDETLLAAVLAQGIPVDPTIIITDLDSVAPKRQGEVKKTLLKMINKRFHLEKLHVCTTEQEGVLLLRHLGGQKRRRSNLRDKRSYLMAEKVSYEGDGPVGSLKVTGYVRGQCLSADRLVHIPGVGSFQIDKIESAVEEHPLEVGKRSGGDMEMADEEVKVLAKSDPTKQESLVMENEPEMFDGEQFLSPEEEAMAEGVMDVEKLKEKKMFKVPKGTSEYQAAWIIDMMNPEDEEEDDEDDSDDDMMEDAMSQEASDDDEDQEEYETMTINSEANLDDNYDEKHVDFAEEQASLKKIKEERTDAMFPDEIDTPMETPARIRFQKYRGLKSFRTSPWDAKENLPADYARIFQFENFNRTKKRVLGEEVDGAEVGWCVTLYIKDVPKHLVLKYLEDKSSSPMAVYGMLPHENKMTVLNFVVKRHSLGHQNAIKSKERLIFHCGYRRFAACPIFSQHTNGDKHKYERFWREGDTVVMTVFAPIFFPPCSILVYQEMPNGTHDLVGTGSLLSVNPDRLVIKRSVLSGHPFKVRKRTSIVRFMFFNREDILWFKPIELRTKYGRRGHIKEPLGTHGHMKCVFDNQVTQQDTVLMNLFKRVFPKWNYDPFVADPIPMSEAQEVDMEHEVAPVTLQLKKKERKDSYKSQNSM